MISACLGDKVAERGGLVDFLVTTDDVCVLVDALFFEKVVVDDGVLGVMFGVD